MTLGREADGKIAVRHDSSRKHVDRKLYHVDNYHLKDKLVKIHRYRLIVCNLMVI